MGKHCPSCGSDRIESRDIGSRTGALTFAGIGAVSAGGVAFKAAKLAEEVVKAAATQPGGEVAVRTLAASSSPIVMGVAMGTTAAVVAAAAGGAMALGVVGQKLGGFFDSNVLINYRCLACNHKFNGK